MYIYQIQFILILVLISGVCPVMYYIYTTPLWSGLIYNGLVPLK